MPRSTVRPPVLRRRWDSFGRGRQVASLGQMQAEAEQWNLKVAGQRRCRPLDGTAPAVVLAAAERKVLYSVP